MLLSLKNLSVERGGKTVVRDISLTVAEGEFVGLIGPNGAGKTSLMRAALGLLPHTGASNLSAMPENRRAHAAAWLPQMRQIAWPMTVEKLIALGRIPYLPRGGRMQPDDQAAVDAAIEHMGLQAFRTRTATQLSGGEQARVLIARALAQDTPLLMADEPIAGLDPASQIATMGVFADLAKSGRGVVASLHDLGLAARHCTRLVMLGQGEKLADGSPAEVLTPANLQSAFGIRAYYQQTPDGAIFQPLEVL